MGRFADPGEGTVPMPGGGNHGSRHMVGAVPLGSRAPVQGQRWLHESYGRAGLRVSKVTMEILLGKLRATFSLSLSSFRITYVKEKAGRNHCAREGYKSTMRTKGVPPGFPPTGDGCKSQRPTFMQVGERSASVNQAPEDGGNPGVLPMWAQVRDCTHNMQVWLSRRWSRPCARQTSLSQLNLHKSLSLSKPKFVVFSSVNWYL